MADAGDGVRKGQNAGAVDGEDGVVTDAAGDGSGGGTVSKLKSAGGNGGEAGEGIVGGEDGRAGAELLEPAGAGDGV